MFAKRGAFYMGQRFTVRHLNRTHSPLMKGFIPLCAVGASTPLTPMRFNEGVLSAQAASPSMAELTKIAEMMTTLSIVPSAPLLRVWLDLLSGTRTVVTFLKNSCLVMDYRPMVLSV
jgi:hypothetical protein